MSRKEDEFMGEVLNKEAGSYTDNRALDDRLAIAGSLTWCMLDTGVLPILGTRVGLTDTYLQHDLSIHNQTCLRTCQRTRAMAPTEAPYPTFLSHIAGTIVESASNLPWLLFPTCSDIMTRVISAPCVRVGVGLSLRRQHLVNKIQVRTSRKPTSR